MCLLGSTTEERFNSTVPCTSGPMRRFKLRPRPAPLAVEGVVVVVIVVVMAVVVVVVVGDAAVVVVAVASGPSGNVVAAHPLRKAGGSSLVRLSSLQGRLT